MEMLSLGDQIGSRQLTQYCDELTQEVLKTLKLKRSDSVHQELFPWEVRFVPNPDCDDEMLAPLQVSPAVPSDYC